MIIKKRLIEDIKKHFDAIYREDGELLSSDHICISEDVDDLIKLVESQPQAYKWIPCSEKLPSAERDIISSAYIVTIKEEGCKPYSDVARYDFRTKTWSPSLGLNENETVIAWQELPEEYYR